MKKRLKILSGFTLTELLVAIGVIGLLFAFLIPALFNRAPSNNKMMFKKAYHILNEAINDIVNNDENYPAEQTLTFGGNEYQRGFNYTKATTNTTNKFCSFLSGALNTDGTVSCMTTAQSGVGNMTTFRTRDGIYWTVYVPVSDSTNNTNISSTIIAASTTSYQFPVAASLYTTKVLVDVNGAKGPNCTRDSKGNLFTSYTLGGTTNFNYIETCNDPDRFVMGVRYDGRLQVGCSAGMSINEACSTITDQNAIDILSELKELQK